MPFKKGYTPWNKGKINVFSKEAIEKMRDANIGKPKSELHKIRISESKKGQIPWIKGKHHTEESKIKMSKSLKGKFAGKNSPMFGEHHTKDSREKMSLAKKGTHCSPETEFKKGRKPSTETRKKISEANRKRKHSEETKQRISINNKGKHYLSEEERKKLSEAHKGQTAWNKGMPGLSGPKHCSWKGGAKLRIARKNHKRKKRGFIEIIGKSPYNVPFVWHHIHPDLPFVVPCPLQIHQMFTGINHYQNVNAMLGIVRIEVQLM